MLRKTIIIFILLFTITFQASAHRPIFPKNNNSLSTAYLIKDYDLSIAIYNQLLEGEEDYFVIDGKKGSKLFYQMLLPKNSYSEDFKPVILIIGPGFSKDQVEIPMDIPSDMGFVVEKFSKTKSFFEPFTQTRYIMGEEHRITLPEDGRYYIAVYDSGNNRREYALAIGEREEWGIRQIAKFPIYWLRVRFWYSPWFTISILLFIGVLVIYIVKRRKLL